VTLSVFDVLNAALRAAQNFAQRGLALAEWSPPLIVTIKHQQIEGTGDSCMIQSATMQGIEVRNAFRIETDNLGVDYC
jgi:hypothetical protein